MSEIRRITVRERGQITLPAAVVRELKLEPGDKLDFEVKDGKLFVTPSRRGFVNAVRALGDALKAAGVSEEEFQKELRLARRELNAERSARRKSA